jgi:hypothetical protein
MQPQLHRRRFLATVGVSLFAAGCNRRSDNAPNAPTGARPAGPAIVKATDGRSQMKLPEGWTVVKDLNEHADLQAGDERREVFAVVLTEPKEDFAADFTYRDFARKRLETFQAALEDVGNKKGPTDVTVSGRPAVQSEFSAIATDERVRLYYIHTSVDGKSAFHQLMTWSLFSARAASRDTLEEAIRGFTDLS